MIDETEKPKIPSKFAKPAARYNEFGYKLIQKLLPDLTKRGTTHSSQKTHTTFIKTLSWSSAKKTNELGPA